MDMLEHSLTTTAEEAIVDTEPSLTFTTDDDNGVAQQSAGGGSLIWLLHQLLSGQHDLEDEEEDEAAEFFDRSSGGDDDDDDVAYQSSSEPESGHPTDEETVQGNNNYFQTVVILNLVAQQQDVDFETVLHHLVYGDGEPGDDGDGGGAFVVVPASGAAVAGLQKGAFHAMAAEGGRDGDECCGVTTGCAICLEDFEDGEVVTVMPCSRGHEFHPGCITKWLGQSNTCPLCRHALPTDTDVVDDGPC